jgi:hypothetical protein
MKTLSILINLIVLSIGLFGQSGSYHPLPDSGAIWREYFGGYEVNCTDYQIYTSGDTLIEGKMYQKLQKFGVVYFSGPGGNCSSNFGSVYNYYLGAYRDDSIGKKVYFFAVTGSSEVLLYDFNLNLNDKLPETCLYQYNVSDTSFISAIDSVLVGDEYHKRFAVSNSYLNAYVYLVEGIGSGFGLVSSLEPPFEFGSTLLCHKQNNVTVYPEQGSDCVLVTGTTDTQKDVVGFSIAPNPINFGVGVVHMSLQFPSAELVISDVTGCEKLRVPNVEDGSVLHAENLSPGIYFYRVMNAKGIRFTGKLLID